MDETGELEDKQSREPGQNQAQLTFKDLYKKLNHEYLLVQTQDDIAEKSKKYEKKEARIGCTLLIITAVAVAAVIFTPLRWYWAAIAVIFIIAKVGSGLKEWDLGYAKDFLERLEEEKQKKPSIFAFTLKKWVNHLPKSDRAKKYFESVVEKMSIPDLEYQWEQETLLQLKEADREEIEAPVPTTPGLTQVYDPLEQETPEPSVLSQPPVSTGSKTSRETTQDQVLCPYCGSDWIRYIEKEPGKITYVCEDCSKKWHPEEDY